MCLTLSLKGLRGHGCSFSLPDLVSRMSRDRMDPVDLKSLKIWCR